MSVKHALSAMSVVIIACAGVYLQSTQNPRYSEYCLANIDALSGNGESLECPDIYDLPNAYLAQKTSEVTVTCSTDGNLSWKGLSLSGGYKKGIDYKCVLVEKACKDDNRIVCCRVVDQGAWLLEPER